MSFNSFKADPSQFSQSWSTALVKYVNSFQVSENSWMGKFFEVALGDEGKNISAIDFILTGSTTTGTILLPIVPQVALPLMALGSVPLYIIRGPKAAFITPLLLYTIIKNPSLALSVVKETAQNLGSAAKEAVSLGLQASGLLVTASGAVVGIVFMKNK